MEYLDKDVAVFDIPSENGLFDGAEVVHLPSRISARSASHSTKQENRKEALVKLTVKLEERLAELGGEQQATVSDFTFEGINKLAGKTGWVILSATNPNNTVQSHEKNLEAHQELLRDLQKLEGVAILECSGRYGNDEHEEPSVIVLGARRIHILALASKYGQESIVTHEGLLFPQTGEIKSIHGIWAFQKQSQAEEAGRGYTRVAATGLWFSLVFEGDEQEDGTTIGNSPIVTARFALIEDTQGDRSLGYVVAEGAVRLREPEGFVRWLGDALVVSLRDEPEEEDYGERTVH